MTLNIASSRILTQEAQVGKLLICHRKPILAVTHHMWRANASS